MWYRDWFRDEIYPVVYRHRDEEEARVTVDLFERTVPLPPGARILDLACGHGRHAIEFARRGYCVTGIDLCDALIRTAEGAAREACVPVRFRCEDMRRLQERNAYDAVVSLFTSFGYFAEESENRSVVASVARALRPDGWFMLDFFNARYVAAHLRPRDETVADGCTIVQERTIRSGRIEKSISISAEGGDRAYRESVRMYTEQELRAMLDESGFRVYRAFGGYDASPISPDSPRVILFAVKRATAETA